MINRINSTNTQTENNRNFGKNNVSFKGAETVLLSGLGWMKNNPAMGACAVDMGSMVIPRTVVETKDRGKQSGIETFIREVSSLLIHATMGLVGYKAASAISGEFNSKHKVNAQDIFASGDTIKNMSEIWTESNENTSEFFEGFVKNIKGLNNTEWKSLSDKTQKKAAEELIKLADQTEQSLRATGEDKEKFTEKAKNIKSLLIAEITKDTGANASYKLAKGKNSKEISGSLSELIDNAVSLSNAFKTKTKEQFPEFVKELMRNKSVSTLLGLGITSLMCISVQPINRMLTKKRTGNDGFVGVDTKENDNSKEFKALTAAAGIGFPIFAISTIGCKPKDLLSNVQYNGKIPSLNQFKFVYGFTISSRLLASRDGNELRESLIKDTLGFSTWLLFGDFVSKLASRAMGGKKLINNPVSQDKKGLSYAKDWLMQSSVKSFEELLLPEASKYEKDGKRLSLKELYNNASQDTKKLVKKVAAAQMLGYLFSGVVLGLGIAKLNIFITKHLHGRDKAHKQMNNELNTPVHQLDTNYLSNLAQKTSPVFKDFNYGHIRTN